MKRLLYILLPVLIFQILSGGGAKAAENASSGARIIYEEPVYESFQYIRVQGKAEAVPTPAAYKPAFKADSDSMKISMLDPVDISVQANKIFIADKGTNSIICTDGNFNVLSVITEFAYKNSMQKFSAPEGVYAVGEKLYIADTGNKRIVILDKDYKTISVITSPESELFSEDLVFAPVKVAADSQGRIYAVVKGVYEGIMALYEDGSFGGFVGSIPVTPDPITLLWKNLMSKEQREKRESFVPVEYSNLMIDSEGFIFTVSLAAEDQNAIRRLNAAGDDILSRQSIGDIPASGAIIPAQDKKTQPSNFVDIAAGQKGLYYALDSRYGRIFTYDDQGNMLFAFGGKNTGQNGTFEKPSAIAAQGNRVFVLDSGTAAITVFESTEYADLIMQSKALYEDDRYKESIESWQEVLRYNNNFVLGYSQIGQAYYQMGQYGDAMKYFKQALDQENYSKAFARWRGEFFSANFALIVTAAILTVILMIFIAKLIRRYSQKHTLKKGGALESLLYIFYVITHPFDGFWDLKHEKRGKAWVSTLLILLTIVTFTVKRGLSGFAFLAVPDSPVDILFELKFILVPLLLFIVANMSITTLMDGKGTLKQIYTASGYVLVPLVLINLPLTLVSNMLTSNEQMFVSMLQTIAILWVIFLVFAALLSTHEYTAGKAVGTIVLTGVAMVIICFIGVLFFSLFSELVGFVYTIIEEVRFR